MGIPALGQLQRLGQGSGEVLLDPFALHRTAEEIGPEEFTERRRFFGKASRAPEFSGQAPEGIILEIGDPLGNVLEAPSLTRAVVGMTPAAVVQDRPERVALECPQI